MDETQEDTIAQNNTRTKTQQIQTKSYDTEIRARQLRVMILLECSRICPFKWMKNLFFCIYCDQRYADPAKLREHNIEHEDIKLARIKIATSRLKKRELLKADITNVGCKLCDTPIDNLDDLLTHLFEKHQKKIEPKSDIGILPFKVNIDDYKCAVCNQKYAEYKSLNHHMNVHYQNYICATCGAGFITPERLRVHSFTHETGSFQCDVCEKVFRCNNSKNEHYANVHMKVKRHRCPQCPETFRNYFQRSKHISTIHGMKLKEFKCDLCPKVFTASGKLGVHIRTMHLKEKRHACDVCEWKFYSKSELKYHMIKHSGERKFQCNVCNKAYARKYTLREHMRIHENDRRFVCTICGKSFVQSCSLKHHSKIHHPCPKADAFSGLRQSHLGL